MVKLKSIKLLERTFTHLCFSYLLHCLWLLEWRYINM